MNVVCENDNREFDPSKFLNRTRDTDPNHEEKYVEKLLALKKSFEEGKKPAS